LLLCYQNAFLLRTYSHCNALAQHASWLLTDDRPRKEGFVALKYFLHFWSLQFNYQLLEAHKITKKSGIEGRMKNNQPSTFWNKIMFLSQKIYCTRVKTDAEIKLYSDNFWYLLESFHLFIDEIDVQKSFCARQFGFMNTFVMFRQCGCKTRYNARKIQRQNDTYLH
jgi:hypothetical protein